MRYFKTTLAIALALKSQIKRKWMAGHPSLFQQLKLAKLKNP
jgi:hypothetical protein